MGLFRSNRSVSRLPRNYRTVASRRSAYSSKGLASRSQRDDVEDCRTPSLHSLLPLPSPRSLRQYGTRRKSVLGRVVLSFARNVDGHVSTTLRPSGDGGSMAAAARIFDPDPTDRLSSSFTSSRRRRTSSPSSPRDSRYPRSSFYTCSFPWESPALERAKLPRRLSTPAQS